MQMNFLRCEWRKLVVANYVVDPSLLCQYTPTGTEIDLLHGKCYISLVGFMFLNTRTLGMAIPGHIDFEEVNLRFYVRRYESTNKQEDKDVRRGVVFIKEIVPKPMLAFVANTLYKEHYEAMSMDHTWSINEQNIEVEYRWGNKSTSSTQTGNGDGRHVLRVSAESTPVDIEHDSDAEFILEHYWGYTRVNERTTYEYRVDHPKWQLYPVRDFNIDVDFGDVYGRQFAFLNNARPDSVFLAEGSDVVVKSKRTLFQR